MYTRHSILHLGIYPWSYYSSALQMSAFRGQASDIHVCSCSLPCSHKDTPLVPSADASIFVQIGCVHPALTSAQSSPSRADCRESDARLSDQPYCRHNCCNQKRQCTSNAVSSYPAPVITILTQLECTECQEVSPNL